MRACWRLPKRCVQSLHGATHACFMYCVQLGVQAALPARGGESAALARLQHYLWGSDAARTYFDTRNGMLGPDFSTKFSPWLAAGCASWHLLTSLNKLLRVQ